MFLELCLSFALAPAADHDLAAALANLTSARAAERSDAERWLAAHLEAADYPALAEYVAHAETEPKLRLEAALSGADRHFELAQLFATDAHEIPRDIGIAALRAMVERWLGGDDEAPADERRLEKLLRPSAPPIALRLGGASVGELVDRIARRAERSGAHDASGRVIPLVVAPELFAATASSPPLSPLELPSIAQWDTMLDNLAKRGGGRICVFEVRESPPQHNSHPWVLVAGARIEHGTTECIVDWSREALTAHDPIEREGAARALASLGFPPANEWLARHWKATHDPLLLSGLALAAGRGLIAPELCDQDGARRLLTRAESSIDSNLRDAGAIEAARALIAIGPTAANGANPLAVCATGFESASPNAMRRRLRVLALASSRLESVERWCRDALAARIGDDRRAELCELALEYLAAIANDPKLAPKIVDPDRLFEAAARTTRLDPFVEAWTKLALGVPESWRRTARDSKALEQSPETFAARWRIALGAGLGGDELGSMLAEFLPVAEELDLERAAQSFGRIRALGRGELLASSFAKARSAAADELANARLDRLAARSGVLEPARKIAAVDRWVREGTAGETDWVALGSLASGQTRDAVLALLLARADRADPNDAPSTPWARGVTAAVLELRANGETARADGLLEGLRKKIQTRKAAKLEGARKASFWPVPPAREPHDLDSEDADDGL